jgi:AraC-like DNA-binding protein
MDGSNWIARNFWGVRRTGPGVALQIDHAHSDIEFNLIISGKGTYFLEDGQHDLAPGTLVWLQSGQSHRLIRSSDLDMWVVMAPPERFSAEMLSDIAARPCRVLSAVDALALDRLLGHLSQDDDEHALYDAGLSYVLRSAWHATANSAGRPARPLHPSVIRALRILRADANSHSFDAVARQCGVTKEHLGRLLLEQTGRGFVDWRSRFRLERFQIIYAQREDLLSASFDAGFGSYSQFHRVFSDIVGMTPGEWAKKGAGFETMALPSEAQSIGGSPTESTRMVWYSLCGITLPAASRWFSPAFATQFDRVPAEPGNLVRIDSGFADLGQIKAFEPEIVRHGFESDPESVDSLSRAFHRNDITDRYIQSFTPYDPDITDLAWIVGMYVAWSRAVALRNPIPPFDSVRETIARCRSALHAAGTFARASLEERRLAAAAFIAQTTFLRNANAGARASGSDVIALRVADAAHASLLRTVGVDVRATRPSIAASRAPLPVPRTASAR